MADLKKYKITWTETVDMQDFIEANSEQDALNKFQARHAIEHMHAEPLTDMVIEQETLKAELWTSQQ
tara:strand:+ start:515 stop:715 length:201 start_codon:yes stop_codon:yes gene_type:complete